MTDKEAELIKHYPEAPLLAGRMRKSADFALIPVILNEFDTVEHTGEGRKGSKKLLFTKKIEQTLYLASIERGNNQLGVITLWKMYHNMQTSRPN